ncbi:carbohydrate ABC transporter permease [Saliterribacillus persicus]|uniref:Carbohydrate ABC transporter membrane protein 1 (CUT1 family) n=1 Tax=Saliterribacillus persicus TaxID=930114 RepID=A0A368Y450_9BACI|nr:sugar ABC transporter permease [Saliterribacillus persicus]RCW74885.1 carbohydrate ABC transporter membrane protein 1 (CUT1 family) [Saliterribacillus persicus]
MEGEVKARSKLAQANQAKVKKKKKRNGDPFSGWQENLSGYLFIAPMFLGTSALVLFPIIASLALSFTDWNFVAGFKNASFVGLENFQALFSNDTFLKSLKNNFIILLAIPITLFVSLSIAVIINKYIYLKDFFKVIFFMPFISSVVAVAVVFRVLFHPSDGPINQLLMNLGINNPPGWISDISYALPSVMLIMIWTSIGFNLIIYLAGLQNIPIELYEAAQIDGASAWYQFTKITIPLVSPTTFLLLITGIISSFKIFDLIIVLTNGGPANSTITPVVYLYQQAFLELKTGYASSVALVMFIIILVITYFQFIGQKKWVNY